MEKILELFSQELSTVDDHVTRLAVVTALHNFMIENTSSKIIAEETVNDLFQCLCSSLTDIKTGSTCQRNVKSNGFLQRNEKIENLLKRVTLNSIYELCERKGRYDEINPQIVLSALPDLKSLLHADSAKPNYRCFRFCQNFTKCFEKYVRLKDCKVKVKVTTQGVISQSFNPSTLKQFLQFYEPETAEHYLRVLNERDIQCDSLSILPDSPNDINVSDLLVSQLVAWRKNAVECNKGTDNSLTENKPSNKRRSNEQNSKPKICDAVITHIMKGNLFWVNIGKDAIESVEEIHRKLKRRVQHANSCKCREDDIVATVVTSETNQQWAEVVRGKVVCVKPSYITVFSIDIGSVHQVSHSSVFPLPPDLDVSVMPPQAHLARLHDVGPTPVDPRVVEISAAILTYLCKSSFVAKVLADKFKVVSSLPVLISCPDQAIALHAARLGTNVAVKSGVTYGEDWCGVMLAALEFLNQLVKKHLDKENSTDNQQKTPSFINNNDNATGSQVQVKDTTLVSAFLRLLGNILHMNQTLKDFFYRQRGLETVIICHKLFKDCPLVRRNVTRVVANFSSANSFFSKQNQFLPGRFNVGETVMMEFNMEDDSDCDETDGDDFGSGEEEEDSNTSGDDVDSPGNRVQKKSSESSLETDKGENPSPGLVKGSKFPSMNDPECEMLQGSDFSSRSLADIVCGIFNCGKKGTICIGIGKTGEVEGVPLSHDMRDEFRLGIDDVMSLLVPFIMHFQLHVAFIPVTVPPAMADAQERGGGGGRDRKDKKPDDLFVIELTCHPLPGVIYTNKGGHCYYRTGRKTMVVNEQDIRLLIVLDEEEKHRQEIFNLQRQRDLLQASDNSGQPEESCL